MSEKTCASGRLGGRTQPVGESDDWHANSESALSRSPYISTHVTCGVPGATFAGAGTRFAQLDVSTPAIVATVNTQGNARFSLFNDTAPVPVGVHTVTGGRCRPQ